MREFYVHSVETCSGCDGHGIQYNEQCHDDITCRECDGSGRVHEDVNLVDALNAIAGDKRV